MKIAIHNRSGIFSARWKTYCQQEFKLKGGADATNVKLVRSKKEASKLINTAFGKGFSQFNRLGNLK